MDISLTVNIWFLFFLCLLFGVIGLIAGVRIAVQKDSNRNKEDAFRSDRLRY